VQKNLILINHGRFESLSLGINLENNHVRWQIHQTRFETRNSRFLSLITLHGCSCCQIIWNGKINKFGKKIKKKRIRWYIYIYNI
jgi:hypothetical protein